MTDVMNMPVIPGAQALWIELDKAIAVYNRAKDAMIDAIPALSGEGREYLVQSACYWQRDADPIEAMRKIPACGVDEILIWDVPAGAYCDPVSGGICHERGAAKPFVINSQKYDDDIADAFYEWEDRQLPVLGL